MGSTVVHLAHGDPARVRRCRSSPRLAVYETVVALHRQAAGSDAQMAQRPAAARRQAGGILLERDGDSVIVGIGVNLVSAPQIAGRDDLLRWPMSVRAPSRDDFAAVLPRVFDRELERWRQFGLEPLLTAGGPQRIPPGTRLTVHDAARSNRVRHLRRPRSRRRAAAALGGRHHPCHPRRRRHRSRRN